MFGFEKDFLKKTVIANRSLKIITEVVADLEIAQRYHQSGAASASALVPQKVLSENS